MHPLDSLSGYTEAWSLSRDLRSLFSGNPRYTNDGSGFVSEIKSQYASRDLVQGTSANRPAVATVGGKTCAQFDGTNDTLSVATSGAISNFIANNAGYIISSFIPLALTTSASNYTNDCVFTDTGGYIGIYLKSNGDALAYNYDGTQDYATFTGGVAVNTPRVVEWRHDSGSVRIRCNSSNDADWQSVASGNTSSLTGTLRLGQSYSGSVYTEMQLFEMVMFSTVPSQAERDFLSANFLEWIS